MALTYYGSRISPHMTETPEGYLICHDVPINRTGTQEYTAGEMQLDGDPERIITVNRYPEDVFDAAALASFEGKDVTSGHPPENLTPENHAAYSKGHVENVRRAGDQTIADLHIKDATLISDIKNGIIREVSCGYVCNWEPDGAGYKQTNIRGNHVAIVPHGRAGHDVAIKDQAAEQAEKGSKAMSNFWRGFLTAFGEAAKDATPEQMEQVTNAAVKALDAAPAGKAPEAEPAAKPEGNTSDEMIERAPKGDDIGSKLDRILEMLEAKARGGRGEHDLHDESDLDEMIAKLSGKGEGEREEEMDAESAVTVPAEQMEDKSACDSAVALLKRVRPAVAQIKDAGDRARVVDALLSTLGNGNMGGILKAAHDSASRAAATTQKTTYEARCAESEANYAALNPHVRKQG
ncbi:hypothetical protein B5F17_13385 [Butyricicoccus pullicaecorum]|uniref:DUF2213 domain-containing protein n=1 Tax=Butyricicoccus pullicaecorum TaxID=501571 RepID=A0A1Y4L6L8_9FIRM|nr:DUF2213 domain-containing protein [Butyricicoccus pullicaecorum]OUP51119.1 hypothetical protein B5F17_13385 [Butyricicoccus pullicaecorum]